MAKLSAMDRQFDKQSVRSTSNAKRLRREMTKPEVLLWIRLKSSAQTEFKIRRQKVVLSKYVVDFFYEDQRIAFEIDGKIAHELKSGKDEIRQQEIEGSGISFVRIPASYVLRDPDAVAQLIFRICSGELGIDDLDLSLQ